MQCTLRILLVIALAAPSVCAAQEDHSGVLLRFGVIGDSGTGGQRQKQIADQMYKLHQQHPFEFVLMLGDNIYPNGNPAYFDEKFKNVYKDLMDAGVEFHAALGNHDIEHPAAENGMVQVQDPAFGYVGNKREYTFAAGPALGDYEAIARFIALFSNGWKDAQDDSDVLQRRISRLKAWREDSSNYCWNILYQHLPLYSYVKPFNLFGLFGHGSYESLRETLEPELVGRVDIVFAGHDHFYQKIKPQKGIHHFVSGSAGKLVLTGIDKDHPNVEFSAREFHFMDIAIHSGELRYRAINDHGELIHSGKIANPCEDGGNRPRPAHRASKVSLCGSRT